jgi:hypothetical protein
VVHSPVYDGERFHVEAEASGSDRYDATLVDARGTRRATASVSLPDAPPLPPVRRGDPLLARDHERPVASHEVMERLRREGLGALPARWSPDAEVTSYLRDPVGMAAVYRDAGLANPAFLLGTSNWVLGRNVRMDAWLHLQTDCQHHRAVEPGEALVVEAAIADLFEKRGHEFVDVDVGLFRREDDAAVASIRLRAIYRLRPPAP